MNMGNKFPRTPFLCLRGFDYLTPKTEAERELIQCQGDLTTAAAIAPIVRI